VLRRLALEDQTMPLFACPSPDATFAVLLDVKGVAALLTCSTRHVYRLTDAGRMPPPVRIGALVRWPRRTVEDWIAGGCKAVG
jgi:excisionase family DNA binding protein